MEELRLDSEGEVWKQEGAWRPAHWPFLPASPHGNRVGISFRGSHFTYWKREECHAPGYLRGNGERSFPGKRTHGRMTSFVENIEKGLWRVLMVSRAFVGPEE